MSPSTIPRGLQLPVTPQMNLLLPSGKHVLRLVVGAVQADGALWPDLAVSQPLPILDQR